MSLHLKTNTSLEEILFQFTSPEELEDFLCGILTPREYEDISQRLSILYMLKKGVPHREIAEKLGVGVSTVTRGSKELQKGRFKYIEVI